jgi:hypothetical protein
LFRLGPVGWIAGGLWLATALAEAQAPIVSSLHTVSIHVDALSKYNDLFDLFGEDLRWPLLYGQRLTLDRVTHRNYASFRVGNVNLEICGPFPAEFAAGDPGARLHGLTFRPAVSAAESVRLLDAAGIRHRPAFSWTSSSSSGSELRFVVLDDEDLTSPVFAISLMEVTARAAEDQQHEAASAALAKEAGGPLGTVRVRDVELALPTSSPKWRTLVGASGSPVGNGPAIRLGAPGPRGLSSVVVEVRSLDQAKRFLGERGLLKETADGRAIIGGATAHGIRIVLEDAQGAGSGR